MCPRDEVIKPGYGSKIVGQKAGDFPVFLRLFISYFRRLLQPVHPERV
jgi:hypothetical protein